MDRRSGGLDEARWNFVIRVLCIYCSAMQNLHTTIGLLFSLKNSMCLEEQCPEEQTTFWLPKILVFGTTRAAASLCLCSQQTQVHRLDSSQYGVNHCYAPQEKVIKEVINVYILPRERHRLFGATTRPCRQGIPAQIPPHLPSSRAVGLDATIW